MILPPAIKNILYALIHMYLYAVIYSLFIYFSAISFHFGGRWLITFNQIPTHPAFTEYF